MDFEWHNADEVLASIRGSQIMDGRIEPDGIYLQFEDQRVLVIIGLPALGIAIVRGERAIH